jgi:hypothetical protein
MADNAGTLLPLTPIKNSLGETMGSILGMIASPHGAERGIVKPRYTGGTGEPAAMEFKPGRPATMKGIDVTTIDDPYEHERGSGVRTLPPAMVRRRFDEGI